MYNEIKMNEDCNRREQIIFGTDYDPNKYYLGGCRRFNCGKEVLSQLFTEGFIDPNDAQNSSPFAKDFLEFANDFENIEYECYAISKERSDYRVTIEGVDIKISDTDFDKVSLAVESFHFADEFSFEHLGDTYYLHAWWD